MRGCLTIFGLLFFIMFLYYAGQQQPVEPPPPVYESKMPDSTREVDHFDWAKDDYVYKDEVIPETHKRKYKVPEPYPDFHVKIVDGRSQPKKQRYTIVNYKGKRVKMYEKANGEIELIPLN